MYIHVFAGDTRFYVFNSPTNQDLLKVKLLIMEVTFLDGDISIAHEKGHIHIKELAENAHYFHRVEHILLVHFLDKYSIEYIREKIDSLPDALKQKVHLGLNMQMMGV